MKLSLEAVVSLGTLAVQRSQAPLQHQEMISRAIRAHVCPSVPAPVSSQRNQVLGLAPEVHTVQWPEK